MHVLKTFIFHTFKKIRQQFQNEQFTSNHLFKLSLLSLQNVYLILNPLIDIKKMRLCLSFEFLILFFLIIVLLEQRTYSFSLPKSWIKYCLIFLHLKFQLFGNILMLRMGMVEVFQLIINVLIVAKKSRCCKLAISIMRNFFFQKANLLKIRQILPAMAKHFLLIFLRRWFVHDFSSKSNQIHRTLTFEHFSPTRRT